LNRRISVPQTNILMQRLLPHFPLRFLPLLLLGVSVVFQLTWLILRWGGANQAVWYADLSYLAVIYTSLMLSVSAFQTASRPRRSAAGLLAAALLALSAGESIWVYLELFTHVTPDTSVADLCYYLFYLLLGLSLLRQAGLTVFSRKTFGLLLDSVIIVGVVGVYGWSLFLAQMMLDSGTPLLIRLVSGSYPVLDLGLLVLVVLVLRGRRVTPSLVLFSGGLALYIVADLGYAFLNSRSAYVSGSWIDVLWTLGTAVLVIGGSGPLALGRQAADARGSNPAWVQSGFAVLPYFAVVASCALLIFDVQRPSLATQGVLWGTVLLFGLVLLRQALVLRENTLLTKALLLSTTNLEASQTQLSHQAFHDVLTSLPNRALLQDRLQQALVSRHRQYLAVLCLDLDGFKLVNDRFGHAAGDAVLVEAARRMREVLREGDTLARMGGDEFTIILCGIDQSEGAEIVAERLMRAFDQPFELGSEQGQGMVSASIGISLLSESGQDAELLQRQADQALYMAKASGKRRLHTFTPELEHSIYAREHIRVELERALERGEFELHYQPQFRSEQLIGMEALLRWTSAVLGSLPPDQFIPVAEDTGLILSIGQWVLDAACAQAASWLASGIPLRVAVNISPLQFAQPEFVSHITGCLTRHQLPGQLLELELTERLVVQDLKASATTIRELQQLGVTVVLDDFGSGNSSVSHLMTLPISAVKIDRNFVLNAEQSPGGQALIQVITSMAQALHLQVVAEGVETEAQRVMVASLGCDVVQGYLLGRPMPAPQVDEWLSKQARQQVVVP